jgi:hypothetical protein
MEEPQEDDQSGEEEGEEEEDEPMVLSVQPQQMESPQVNTNDFTWTKREQEWQREREIVSRHARDPINSKRLIYIESDEEIPQEDPKHSFDVHLQTNFESVVDEQPLDEEPLDEEPFDEEVPDDESFDEELEDFEPDVVPVSQPVMTQAIRVEEEPIYEDDDDGSEDIWRQDTFYSEPEHVLYPLPTHDQNTEMEQEALDNDDGGDDIWQLEARDQSHLSQQSESRVQREVVQEPPSPWRKAASLSENQDQLSSSPAYVTVEHRDGLHQVPTHIRKLRDQNVDLSAILAEEETPNRARYYNGTSTPREMPSRRPGGPLSSAMKSASSTRKTGQRVRLQPISQSSPEIGSEAEFSYSPAFKPNNSHQEPIDEEVDEPFSDATHETGPGYTDAATATPKPPRQSDQDAPASTWFQRITSLTPRWLKAPTEDEDDSSSSAAASEDEYEDDDKENRVEIANIESAQDVRENRERAPLSDSSSESPSRYLEESASPPPLNEHGYVPSIEQEDERSSEQGDFDDRQDNVPEVDAEGSIDEEDSVEDDLVEADAVEMINTDHAKSVRPRPLPTFGYFSDEHYKALRRLYRMAKRSPGRFHYHEAPGRAEIIGDWIWTSDGHHGVPITEAQFAIIDRFVHDLSRADVEYGGSGQVEWTEADLHRRLISIIIGEQIRENQKAKSARGVSVDTRR